MSTTATTFTRGRYPLFVRRFVTGAFQENTWLIRDEETGLAALVDPGDDIVGHLERAGLAATLKLAHVFLTHAHLDHVWGLSGVRERWPDAPITMHPHDAELLAQLPMQGQMVGLPIQLPPPPKPDHFVEEGETVTLGKRQARVVHTPGHTRGGICYLFDTGDCFVGDMIIAGSVGRTDLPGGEPHKMKASLLKLCALDPEIWIHGGHGPQAPLREELRTNAVLPGLVRAASRLPADPSKEDDDWGIFGRGY